MSFFVGEADPNTTVVKKCLRLGIEKYGVPNEIYTDNGKDYKAKELSEEYPLSVMNVLGIGKVTATPYHGQAKPVERFFRTLEERFGKMFYSYTGNDAKKRPEHMQKTNKVLDNDNNIPTLEYYVERLTEYINEYNNTAHHGDGMDGKTPNQVYSENITEIREIGDSNALRLLFGKTVERTVQKNGISMYNNTFTNHDGKLIPYYDRKVMVTYDPDDL
ncbi:MAG: Mu transposase C-terminal domain-containing protein [Ruminococcus sp.]|nr:Mu transposase C-terminal domain-containing protein [Ruminococcus sp.]